VNNLVQNMMFYLARRRVILYYSGTGSRYEDMPPFSLIGEWLKVQATATHFGHTVGNNNNINNMVVSKAARYIV